MERFPSETGKNTWDHDTDDDTTPSSSSKKRRSAVTPAAPSAPAPTTEAPAQPVRSPRSTAESLFAPQERSKDDSETSRETSKESDQETPQAEKEAQNGELTPEEVQIVIQQYVSERTQAINEEQAETDPNSPTAAVAQADKRFLELIDEHAQNVEEQAPVDDILEQAHTKVVQELEQESTPDESNEAEDDAAASASQPAPTATHPAAAGPAAPLPHSTPVGAPRPPVMPGAPLPPAGAHPAMPHGTPRTTPNTAPATPAGAGTPPRTPNINTGPGPFSPNMYPATGNVNLGPVPLAATEQVSRPEQTKDRLAQGLLIGGVVGYLVGRRRGRIKTEKRLLPIQEKLEKEVGELHQKIVAKEQEVRSIAAQKSIAEQAPTPKPPHAEKPQSKPASEIVVGAGTTIPEKAVAAVKAEKPRFPKAEAARSPQQAQVERIVQGQNVDHLPLVAVKQAAEAVAVDGGSLARAFEAGHIDEAGLRHVVAEFARTGHAERSFRAEVSAQQKRRHTAEQINTLLNPEKTVRTQRVTSRNRDRSQISVRHDLTPMDTASLAQPAPHVHPPAVATSAANASSHSKPTVSRLPILVILVAIAAVLWFVLGH